MRICIRDNLCTVYKLNLHRIQDYLVANGHSVVDSPEDAELLIAGVCAAFDADEERASRILDDLAQLDRTLYVIGCLVTVRPDLMPAAARAFASWEYRSLAEELTERPRVPWKEIEFPTVFRSRADYRVPDPTRHFVAVSLGCDFDCSYCPHKLGAGPSESRSVARIIAQVQDVLERGAKTIVLTGVDTASYGRDSGSSFAAILERILSLPGNSARYHIAQFNPEGIADPLHRHHMAECCADRRIVDLQLPIQTTSDRLLDLMCRRYDAGQVAEFTDRVRQRNEDIFLRTDLLVGFPTETDAELEQTIQFTARHFNEAAVYGFELKAGTRIAAASPALIDAETIRRRILHTVASLKDAGLLVHSGGQQIETLHESDLAKENMRCCRMEVSST